MSSTFGYKALSLAVVSALAATSAHSAGLDRSGQDVTAFLQDGTYAEAVYTYIDADVSGHDNGVAAGAATNNYVQGKPTGDSAEDYDFFRFGVKGDLNDRFSVGVLYDEPFGAAVQYSGDNNFVADANSATVAGVNLISSQLANSALPANVKQAVGRIASGITTPQQAQAVAAMLKNPTLLAQDSAITSLPAAQQAELQVALSNPAIGQGLADAGAKLDTVANNATALDGEGTNVEIRTNNVTALVGTKFGEKRNFQIYGGPAAQRLNGEVHLRGIAYQGATGYDAKISTDTSVGWVAGVAYSKPEIALKAALTYRSEIDHETTIAEVFPNVALRGLNPATTKDFKVTLPESYNLDFQTGVNPTTLLTAKVRYVPWSDFNIKPTRYTEVTGLPIISYSDDQWSAEVGLGKRVSDRLALSGSVGWDSGAGNPVSTLGPIEGYWSLGLGAKYNVTPEWSVSVGGKYLKFGDATANLPNGMTAGEFSDNDGFIAGVKLAYQAK